jgi:hypothetical protein
MTRWSVFVWLVLMWSGAVSAQSSSVREGATVPPLGRLDLSTSISLRVGALAAPTLGARYVGTAPGYVRLAGALFSSTSRYGVFGELGYDWFTLSGTDLVGNPARLAQRGFRSSLGAAARFRPASILTLEAQVGYGFNRMPAADSGGPAGALRDVSITYHGLLLGGVAELSPAGPVQFGFRTSLLPLTLKSSSPLGLGRALSFTLGAFVATKPWRFTNWALQGMAEYELFVAGARTPSSTAGQAAHRLGLGLRFTLPDKVAQGAPPPAPPRVSGNVVFDDSGAPVPEARVLLSSGESQQTGPSGSFIFEEVPEDTPLTVRVSIEGFAPVEKNVSSVDLGEVKQLEFRMKRLTGPGTIRGTVNADQGGKKVPLSDAAILAPNGEAVRSAADGTFSLPSQGPGPVPIRIQMDGYQTAEEVVVVPAGGESALDVVLRKKGSKTLATVRGRVRTITGKAVPATMTIPELKINTRTDKGGNFLVRLPGGRYTVQFEAKGYYKQSKVVEVADGDQALFYIDLTPQE